MTACTRLMTAGVVAVGLLGSGLGSGFASAEAANGTSVPVGLNWRACDFSRNFYIPAVGAGSGNATIRANGTDVTADVFFMIGVPNTPYQVRLIQGPRPASRTCNPGDPGVAGGVLITDGNGVGRLTLHDTVESGSTNAWVFIEGPPPPGAVRGDFFTSDVLTDIG